MSNKAYSSTQKSYYLPGDPSRTPLTHEEFCDIMRPFWKQRKRLQRAGECNAPARHVCMCDCTDCPYRRCGNTIPMETLESIGEEVADSYCMEDDVIRCMVLHERDVTERQLAALISKATGQKYSHQAVHKRIPAAAKRLADLLNYAY